MKKMKKRKRQPKQHTGRLAAATVSSLLAVSVAGVGIWQQTRTGAEDATAKESFQGIGQIVEEHEDAPFVILDVVPGTGTVTWTCSTDNSTHTYDVSLGTIGYLNAGQSPAEQDLKKIFTTGDDASLFHSYENRQSLASVIVPSGYENSTDGFRIAYEETYGGMSDGTGWIKLFDAQDDITGCFYGSATEVDPGKGDYIQPTAASGTVNSISLLGPNSLDGGIYINTSDGEYRVIFKAVDDSEEDSDTETGAAEGTRSGYVAVRQNGNWYDYANDTSVYHYANGVYEYVGTVGDQKAERNMSQGDDDEDGDDSAGNEDVGNEGSIGDEDVSNEGSDNSGNNEGGDNSGNNEGGDNSGNNEGGDNSGNNEGGDNSGNNEGGDNSDSNEGSDNSTDSEDSTNNDDGNTTYAMSSNSADVNSHEWQKFVSDEEGDGDDFEDSENTDETDSLYVVIFEYSNNIDAGETVYQVEGTPQILSGDENPYDRYAMGGESSVSVDVYAASGGTYQYVGPGKGNYVLTQDANSSDTITVLGAPVYFRVSTMDWLRKYVFSSLKKGDNESDDFEVEVRVISADKLTGADVYDADLVFLDGADFLTGSTVTKSYITQGDKGDLNDEAANALIKRAVEDLLPVIVDYDIVKNTDTYKDSQYQKTAKVFRKQDLADYYYDMDGQLKDILMNLEKDNKDDNSYHYVNKNIYFINDTLATAAFNVGFSKSEAEAGFSEIKAAIAAENLTISDEDDKLSETISKAKAVQYIINYAVGLIGDYKDLTILELQPGSNPETDLIRSVDEDKENVVLYWKRSDSSEAGQQILRSSKIIATDIATKSTSEFNGELEDINKTYDMVFIGLDGQTLNRNKKDQETVYNNEDLNGKIYHTGDRVAGQDAQYDCSDITQQKKEALLDYMRAGYPVVVENSFFTKSTAKDAKGNEIDTDYVGSDTQMYDFLKTAKEEYGDYLYTVSDVRGNALFRSQLNVIKPRITESADGQETSTDASGVQVTELTEDGKYQGTIRYTVSNDRGEAYYGDISTHLYLDMNMDGVYAASEEPEEYTISYDGSTGQIDVLFDGILSGMIPWKLEITDAGNDCRRDSIEGYFKFVSDQAPMPVSILQVLNNKGSDYADLQHIDSDLDNSMLGYFLEGGEALTNTEFTYKTVTVAELEAALSENAGYLNQWDILVLGFGDDDSVTLGGAAEAVNAYISDGRSVLMSSAGAADNRLGLSAAALGQAEGRTYGNLGSVSGSLYRYAGLGSGMFDAQQNLFADKVNDGIISYYPYEVGEVGVDITASVKAPTYLLDLDANADESVENYVTAWYTLDKPEQSTNAYNVSVKDAGNNYYIYSKANVVYVGQKDYPYVYDGSSNAVPTGEGSSECKLFVNALMAAYQAGVHRSQISIVAGFQSTAAPIESISIPFDQVIQEDGEEGILDETVDVYFKFADNNLSLNKEQTVKFYYEDPSGTPIDVGGETVNATEFSGTIDTVEQNRLVTVGEGQMKQQQVYRIKAPVVALQKDSGVTNADIYVVLETTFRRGNKEYTVLSSDSVSLNRAQLFLLE